MIATHWLTEPVTVTPWLGAGSLGDSFGPAVTTDAAVDMGRKLVRDSAGKEVTAEATIFTAPMVGDPTQAAEVAFVPESKVTVRGVTRKVITSKVYTRHGVPWFGEITTT